MKIINKRNYLSKLKKYIFAFISLIILLTFINLPVYAEEAEKSIDRNEIIDQQTQSGEVKKIESQLEQYSRDGMKDIFPEYDPQKIMGDIAKGKFEFSFTGLINKLVTYLFKEIYMNLGILVKLVVLVVLCAILRNLQTSFLSEGVGEIAFYACYIVIVSIMIVSLNTALGLGRDIIDNMVSFMQATIPALITLLISGGNITSAGIFQPILIMIVEISATLMKNFFIPLIFLSVILSVVDNISDKVQISRLASFIKQVSMWCLGFILTIFIGVVSVQGALGAVVDGVTSKTAKYAINALIPIVGKYLSDAAEAVVGCTLLIKNAAGVVAMIGIIGICIFPLLKIFALMIMYRITCILIEPISEKRITNCMNDMANSLVLVLGIVAAVAFMFLISITAIISASNISTMIR